MVVETDHPVERNRLDFFCVQLVACALNELWPTWSREMATMIYAEILSIMDLPLLTATVANKKEIMKQRHALSHVGQ